MTWKAAKNNVPHITAENRWESLGHILLHCSSTRHCTAGASFWMKCQVGWASFQSFHFHLGAHLNPNISSFPGCVWNEIRLAMLTFSFSKCLLPFTFSFLLFLHKKYIFLFCFPAPTQKIYFPSPNIFLLFHLQFSSPTQKYILCLGVVCGV